MEIMIRVIICYKAVEICQVSGLDIYKVSTGKVCSAMP